MKSRILVVDDEKDILELVEYNLSKEGYSVACVTTGELALDAIEREKPDLVLLDLMLPGVDGYEVVRRLRQDPETAGIPVIMLTARGEESDVVAGLELGAEDYVTKPFSPTVLAARIRNVLRRNASLTTETSDVVQTDRIRIDPLRFEAAVDGKPVELTATEFHLLHFMAKRPGRVFTRSQLIDAVKGSDYPVTDRSVDVQIVGLRRKLKPAGDRIETVRGIGYRFKG
jgi:two-component system, OmpR family, alkaline phosphatase synthesis response regulator PhoP